MQRPKGSNADEWAMFVEEFKDQPSFLAVQIAEAIEDERRKVQTWRTACIDASIEREELRRAVPETPNQ